MRLLMVGIEVHHTLYAARRNKPETPVSEVTEELGYAHADVVRGLRLVRAYSVQVEPIREETGAF